LVSQSHGAGLAIRDQYMKCEGTLSLGEEGEELSQTEMLSLAPDPQPTVTVTAVVAVIAPLEPVTVMV
jgi:hypothetical protein